MQYLFPVSFRPEGIAQRRRIDYLYRSLTQYDDKMKKLFIALAALLTWSGMRGTQAAPQVRIVPWPNRITVNDGALSLAAGATVKGEKGFAAKYLTDMLREEFGIEAGKVKITLDTDAKLAAALGEEGYTLDIDGKGIRIAAADKKGLFYGVQTLRQLITADKNVPYVSVEDRPAFGWRAFLLDEARYFKGKEVARKMIDEMARLKMNVLQWHLTDDAGWRIEIKKYPLLTEVGSKRDSSEIGTWNSGKYDPTPQGGFYTQDEIREMIAYAADRNITIVPEIEMPGHASAAIAAYPWLGTTKEKIKVPIKFAGNLWVYNVADPKVYEFLQDVITEVAALFPSPVIHIGGDEVRYDHWKLSPEVKALMQREGMRNLSDVQVYFTNNMSKFIEGLGKRMMGWNEILGKNVHEWSTEANAASATLAPNAVIHFWKGDAAIMKEALAKGHEVVNSTHNYTYLDYNYNRIPVRTAYGFDPVPEGISPEQAERVLGLGCQMWSEWTPTPADMYRLAFPRIAAYAETGWTKRENKDFARFERVLPRLRAEWKSRGIGGGE